MVVDFGDRNSIASVYAQVISTTVVSMDALGFMQEQLRTASAAHITIEGAAIRYRYDGSPPTNLIGHPSAADSELLIDGTQNVLDLNFIRSGGSDATINITLLN